jgi:hypothetical protein
MRIIVGAVISLHPYSAGMAWNWIHYALGLRKLGHETYYVEEIAPAWCVDADGRRCDFDRSISRNNFRVTMERFGLMENACQIYNRGEATFGLSLDSLVAAAREADLLINMSGHVTSEFVLSNVKRRVYVDQDPVFTQLWHAEYGKELNLKSHDVFFSAGLNIGTPYTSIPDCGLRWHPILPPVVLEYWPFRIDASCRRFTSVASWSGYSDLCYRGEWYRTKYEEFKRFAGLPGKVDQEIEVVLKSYREDDDGIRLLKDNGWTLSKADRIGDLTGYQNYIARSRAEIGIAKNAYVKGCSGWFSDRSAHYLASGKPALVQSTGFERCVPTGRGLLTFRSVDEAVEGINAINQDYETHCRAAREFAEEYLDYRKVLPGMLELCTIAERRER